jgi:hypothetical protein
MWSDTVHSVKLMQNRIWSPTGLNIHHPLPATHCLYLLYFEKEKVGGRKGGGVEPERRWEWMGEAKRISSPSCNYRKISRDEQFLLVIFDFINRRSEETFHYKINL